MIVLVMEEEVAMLLMRIWAATSIVAGMPEDFRNIA
jgi:hypothetical protein